MKFVPQAGREALERHAPDVPVADMVASDTGPMHVMEALVAAGATTAAPGDTHGGSGGS
jgi:hypothetical protein